MKQLLTVFIVTTFLLCSTQGWSRPPCKGKNRYNKCLERIEQATSSLPVCQGSYTATTWTDCFGVYTHAGDKYFGEWKHGKHHGQGTYVSADGSVKEGVWNNGTFLYSTNPNTPPFGDYSMGEKAYKQGDYNTALREWKLLAMKRYAPAQLALGNLYAKGQGVSQNYKTAAQWFTKAAKRGHAPAQTKLGDMYFEGQGVPADDKQAFKWYKNASGHGYAPAQSKQGTMYEQGRGVPQNNKMAVRWYKLAAKKGHAPAQRNLGLMYATGRGILRDLIVAHMWLNIAASQFNHMDAMNERDNLEKKMTSLQIQQAQDRARLCISKNYKDC